MLKHQDSTQSKKKTILKTKKSPILDVKIPNYRDGKKVLSIEPGFGEYLDKSNKLYVFNQTQDSYSVDMFLRYLNDLNE